MPTRPLALIAMYLVLTPAAMAKDPKPGEEREFEIADGVKMKFCWIPAGEAQLGSPKAERLEVLKQIKEEKEPEWLAAEAEEIRGKFKTKGFWLAKYPVTQAEWKAVMDGNTPSHFKGDQLPVEQVSWNDCRNGFLPKLNKRSGTAAVFGNAGKFVLPHEDEWEYACRGGRGNRQAFYFGDVLNGTQANCNGNYPFGTETKGPYLEQTSDVGRYASKSPHPWGLCDMHGNVWQWCENKHSSGNENDRRLLRGGSWSGRARDCRAAGRSSIVPGYRISIVGFRVYFRPD